MKNCRQIILLVTFFSLLSVGWSQCDDGYVQDVIMIVNIILGN
ncbi:MAG: hypothetical protein QGI44_03880 [Candidatus Marinimicrobia bacterium]|nr:hypothetical protein [Candidatus Neomarinimicrobiota bacterium]